MVCKAAHTWLCSASHVHRRCHLNFFVTSIRDAISVQELTDYWPIQLRPSLVSSRRLLLQRPSNVCWDLYHGSRPGPCLFFSVSRPSHQYHGSFSFDKRAWSSIGLARIIGSVLFAFVIGLCMAIIFRSAEEKRLEVAMAMPEAPASKRSLWKTSLFFLSMILFLIFSDWYSTNDFNVTTQNGTQMTVNVRQTTKEAVDFQIYNPDSSLKPDVIRMNISSIKEMTPVPSLTTSIHEIRWFLAGLMGVVILLMTWRWFDGEERRDWMSATWEFSKMIIPLLFGGVFLTGFIGVLIPEHLVAGLVGNNGLLSNLTASVIGSMWYFATLTEIPIVQTLMNLGMAKGPALALLLAGPALSVPSIFGYK